MTKHVTGRPDRPNHIAVIMDGNGRWATTRDLPRTAGHRQGAEAARRVVRAAGEFGIPYVTLFGFSAENWRRPTQEVEELVWLLRSFVQRELDELHRNGVCIRIIGRRTALPADLQGMLDRAERQTRANRQLTVTLALNYGGRQDILEATKSLARNVVDGGLAPEAIDIDRFAAKLSTAGIPDPDLLVRTSGEQRISNFLLWQCAYAEMVFLDKLWPDVGGDDVWAIIQTYQQRDRRFGALP